MGPTTNSAAADKRRVRNELQSFKKEVYFRIGPRSIGPIRPVRYRQKRFVAALILLALSASVKAAPREEPRVIEKVTPLPVALDKDFEFRKTKLFLLSEKTPAGLGTR